MKTKIAAIFLVVGFMLPVNANALFFNSMVQGMTSVANNMVDEAGEVSSEMMQLMSKLSDDIGLMADRILVMADKIGEMADRILVMADKIGEMADRIVATEQLMADMMVDIADIKKSTSTNSNLTEVFITQLEGQDVLDEGTVPVFNMSKQSSEYLVYVSSTMTMTTNTVSVLVHNQSELEALWSSLDDLASDNKIYIAVKIIEDNSISSRSNVLTYTTTY